MREGRQVPLLEGKGMIVQFKLVTVTSLVIVFTSVFLVHFIFNNYFRISEMCAMGTGIFCVQPNTTFLFLFSLFVIVAFIIVIETTVYLMFREVEMEMRMSEMKQKHLENDAVSLKKRKGELLRAKKDAQRKYFKRQIAEKTYEGLKEKYDTEIAEIEAQMKEIRKREIGGWPE